MLKRIDDYPAFLEACWQEHLQPKPADAPTVISTFAGAGGSSLGYSMAGFRELLAVEWDDNAVETFELNFPGAPVYHGDIARLSVGQCLEMTGLQPGELDIFDGSPPCQGFSTAGKRQLDDPRNSLFKEYIRLLRGLRPKVFVMENVSGMVKGVMKLVFAEILRELKASDYKVSARLLNAMYFGVPQSRERMIFVGVRDDLGVEPSHPKAESVPVTVGEAIGSVKPSSIKPLSSLYAGYYDNAPIGQALGKSFADWKIDPNQPAPTIRKKGGFIHWREKRWLSLTEYVHLGSFGNYKFEGHEVDGVNRIGNSVPPLFMRAIARHIRHEILSKAQVGLVTEFTQ
jgi:DNA (cytosine-5)-methyltransferase 1